jgi:hypothetical protein
LPALWGTPRALLAVPTAEALIAIRPAETAVTIRRTETLAAIGRAETAEEILKGRPALRIVFIEAQIVAARIDPHLDRDDGRLHFFDDVSKTYRALHALRINGSKHGAAGRLRPKAKISEDRPRTKAGGGRKKNNAMPRRHASFPRVQITCLGRPQGSRT